MIHCERSPRAHGGVAIGSYPRFDGQRYSTEIVLRSRDGEALLTARAAVEDMLAKMAVEPSEAQATN